MTEESMILEKYSFGLVKKLSVEHHCRFYMDLLFLRSMKQKLRTMFVMYLANYTEKQPLKSRMKCKMNQFTVLENPKLTIGHKGRRLD